MNYGGKKSYLRALFYGLLTVAMVGLVMGGVSWVALRIFYS